MATFNSNVWWSALADIDATSIAASDASWVSQFSYGVVTYPKKQRQPSQLMTSNCKNCGGPLNWLKSACEYCGTFFAQ